MYHLINSLKEVASVPFRCNDNKSDSLNDRVAHLSFQVYVHLRCAGHGEDGHGPRGDALPAARGRRGRDPSLPLHRGQRDEDDGSSSGLRPDPAGENGRDTGPVLHT